jgi:hypothetical protein
MVNLLLAVGLALATGMPADEVKWTEIQLKHVGSPFLTRMFDGGGLPLPPGIDVIVALNDGKRLLVRGSTSSMQEFIELIALLDKPLVKAHVESWLIAIDEKLLPKTMFKPELKEGAITPGETSASIFFVIGKVEDALATLKSGGKATVIAHSIGIHESNRLHAIATTHSRQHSSALEILQSVAANGIVMSIRWIKDRSDPPRKTVSGRLLNVTLEDGGAVALTAPGYKPDDGMMLILRVSCAR